MMITNCRRKICTVNYDSDSWIFFAILQNWEIKTIDGLLYLTSEQNLFFNNWTLGYKVFTVDKYKVFKAYFDSVDF